MGAVPEETQVQQIAAAGPVGRPYPGSAPVMGTMGRPRPTRSTADVRMRRLLRIPDQERRADEQQAYRLFSASMTLSATRCLLSYVIIPIVAPLVGSTGAYGHPLGIAVGLLAIVFDVRATRRFWLADHAWRWRMTFVYAAVILMVTGLVVNDAVALLT